MKKKQTIFVGVSGGVDSSVSAALLKQAGHDVVGVFIRTWQPEWIECTWKEERRDAMRVCAHLDIPFMELNLEGAYKKGVADYMIGEYKAGRTPNPDVMCNKEVKFGAFLNWAMEQGADAVATGHYAQNHKNKLMRGNDTSKDQSYFLYTLASDQLQHIHFPVGHLPKSEVRELAEKFGLPTASKKDSQGICFIGKISMKEFLSHYIDEKEGDVLDQEGNTIGRHPGALFFTRGERHGFEITEKGTDDRPYYVIGKDIEKNTLTVSPDPQIKNESEKITLVNCNWISHVPELNKKYAGQIRYHGDEKEVQVLELDVENKTAVIEFSKNDPTIASGQSVVLYAENVCLGGGVVDKMF